ALDMLQQLGVREVARRMQTSPSNIRNWKKQSEVLHAFAGNQQRYRVDGAGRPTIIPNPDKLVAFMTAMSAREKALSSVHIIMFLKKHERQWLNDYVAAKPP
ncbi:unnamed protein product, partial [Aphanomyces euteiches]